MEARNLGWPTTDPEMALVGAVAEIFDGLATLEGKNRKAVPTPQTRYLHLWGRASAKSLREPNCVNFIRYSVSAAEAAGPSHNLEIKGLDGTHVVVSFAPTGEPNRSALVSSEPPSAGAFPDMVIAYFDQCKWDLMRHHTHIVGRVQTQLDILAGKRGATLEDNKVVVRLLNGLAEGFGVALLYDGKPVYLRVIPLKGDGAGSFQVRLTGSDQKVLKTSMAFPALTAVPKAAVSFVHDIEPTADASDPADK
jgi:hypothetical protein